MMITKELLPYIYTAFGFLPVLIGIYKKKYSLLWFYTLAGFISSLLIAIVFYNQPERFLIANSYIITEFVLLFYFFRKQFNTSLKRIALLVLPLFIIGTANIFYTKDVGFRLQQFHEFDSFSASIFSFSFILLCILGFVKIIQEKSVLFLEKSGFFWANTAIFLYTTGIFFLFLFTRYLISHDMYSYVGQLWQINDSLLIIKSVMLSISFSCKKP